VSALHLQLVHGADRRRLLRVEQRAVGLRRLALMLPAAKPRVRPAKISGLLQTCQPGRRLFPGHRPNIVLRAGT
jgi:hypothetical protein